MKTNKIKTIVALLSFLFVTFSFIISDNALSCMNESELSSSESITDFDKNIFSQQINGNRHPFIGFSAAYFIRANSEDEEVRNFSEYWIARSLYQMGLIHTANNAFYAILSRNQQSGSKLATATANCIIKIRDENPAIMINSEVLTNSASSMNNDSIVRSKLLYLVAINALNTTNDLKKKREQFSKIISSLDTKNEYSELILLYAAVLNKDYDSTIKKANILLTEYKLKKPVESLSDHINMFAGRAQYASGNFKSAAKHFGAVRRNSNQLPEAVSELSWAHLMDNKYQDSIGATSSLQMAALKKTFTPDSPMVMAMSYNELCLYPDSLKSAELLSKHYTKVNDWLIEWNSDKKSYNLYNETINFIRKKSSVPERIGTEWTKSHQFLSKQEEINLLIDTRKSALSTKKNTVTERINYVREIREYIKHILPDYLKAKKMTAIGDELPSNTKYNLRKLSQMVQLYKASKLYSPVLRKIANLSSSKANDQIAINKKTLSTHLEKITERMLVQLTEVADNTQFIRAEIYHSASDDIVWQNTNPEFKDLKKGINENTVNDRAPAASVWNWGAVDGPIDGDQEVWEDEIGTISANLANNCSSKDRFEKVRLMLGKRSE